MSSGRKDNGHEPDEFLEDDAYEEYTGPDLSDDPMAADDRKKRRMKRHERKLQQERERLEKERAAIRAEILAEMEAEKNAEQAADAGGGDTVKPAKKRRRGRFPEYLMTFLSGNILSRSEVRKVYPYLLFIAFLAFLYIGNVFRMQHLYRRHERLSAEVKELRAKSLTIASQKMNATRQSNIMQEIEKRGIPLHESLTPNRVIEK